MPGKYSYGVVLADYSNRGIISLTDEQQKQYAPFAPKLRPGSRASTQVRVKGVRSAQAGTYRPSTSHSAQQQVPKRVLVKESSLSLSAKSQAGRYRPTVNANLFEPPPVPSSLNQKTGWVGQPKQPEHRQTDVDSRQQILTSPADRIHSEALPSHRQSQSIYDDEEPPLQITDAYAPKRLSRSYETLQRYARELQERTATPTENVYSSQLPGKSSRASPEGTQPPPYVKHVKPESPPPPISPRPMREPPRSASVATVATRMAAPLANKPYSQEPNFDDFVDGFMGALDYFDTDRGDPTPFSSQPNSVNSPQRTPTRGDFEHDTFLQMALPSKSRPRKASHDRDTPSRATMTTSTSVNSMSESQPARTNSSVSSLHSLSNLPTSTTTTKSLSLPSTTIPIPAAKRVALSPRARSPAMHADPPWLLPKIKEDEKDFTPSIFEDKEAVYVENQDKGIIDFSGSKVGQISSGRDVKFDREKDDDACSDMSAACPPPITRFKDDEAEFNANMTKMFGDEASGSGKRSGGTVRRGLFSRFKKKG